MSQQQPVQLTPEGSVRCCYCRTDEHGLPPGTETVSDQHWGVRFSPLFVGNGPSAKLGRHPGEMVEWLWKISLDGEDVTNDCFEFEAGDSGWVALYHRDSGGKRVICKGASLHADEDHALAYIERGKVKAEKVTVNQGAQP